MSMWLICLFLQEAFGNTYTSKLEKMFQDIELSKGLNERFREHIVAMSTKAESKLRMLKSMVCRSREFLLAVILPSK